MPESPRWSVVRRSSHVRPCAVAHSIHRAARYASPVRCVRVLSGLPLSHVPGRFERDVPLRGSAAGRVLRSPRCRWRTGACGLPSSTPRTVDRSARDLRACRFPCAIRRGSTRTLRHVWSRRPRSAPRPASTDGSFVPSRSPLPEHLPPRVRQFRASSIVAGGAVAPDQRRLTLARRTFILPP